MSSFGFIVCIFSTLIVLTRGGCEYNSDIFDCTKLQCSQNHVTCTQGNLTQCHCSDGYLWRTGETICAYQQYKKKDTLTWQGCFILLGISGIGMIHIKRIAYGIGQIIFSFATCFIVCIAVGCTAALGLDTDIRACKWINGMVAIAHLIWWAISMAYISNGKISDGEGCPLF